jgi:histone acetyltransferase 1
LYLYLLQRPDIAELTIEDPSEAFQDMRDKSDYRTLKAAGTFEGISAPLEDATWYETTRREWKLATRQFARVLELALRKQIAAGANGKQNKGKKAQDPDREYRLLVKERLHRQNYEILAAMEKPEKKDTLQQTYESVVDEYDRLLEEMKEI